jgi:glycine cleavage system transcriptional repressor
MHDLVLSAVGADRPGLVDRLTEILEPYRANVADSRMVNLHGQFAIIMRLKVPDEQFQPLHDGLPDAAQALGLAVVIRTADQHAAQSGVPYRIRTYAMDQAGLVHHVAHALSTRGVNIEDLTTRLDHGPHTGTPLFSMDMIVTIPVDVKLRIIRQDLENLCAELNCDLDIDRA